MTAEVFDRCERWLTGHGPVLPRAQLAALAREAGEAEAADSYGEGELITGFERQVAELLGKPAAAFVPSGTMAQQIALRMACDRARCSTVAFHPVCHLELHEQRGYSFLHGLRARLVGERHRLIARADLDAIAEPVGALLLELPQREIGGQLPPWVELDRQAAWARERGVAIHLDGARLWESRPFYGRTYAQIAALFDTVYVSFYKILGGIAGAALAGPADTIAHARVWIRRHGGTLVSQHPFVLSARAGLRERLPRIAAYVARAQAIAQVLARVPGIRIVPDPPHTNMMHAHVLAEPERLLEASAAIAADTRICLFRRLRIGGPGSSIIEIHVGEAAFAIEDAELESLFSRLLESARAAR